MDDLATVVVVNAMAQPLQTFSARYVILRHEGIAEPHYDLMFETAPGSPLATWRSDVWPILAPAPLVRLPDHRREYLEYEGAISGNRGEVQRVEAGQCSIAVSNDGWRIGFEPPASSLVLVHGIADEWRATPQVMEEVLLEGVDK